MTTNCTTVPLATKGSTGWTSSETSVAAVTARVLQSETLPSVAVIVVVPTLAPVARPWEPAALEIVAKAGADEVQVTRAVRSWRVLSL